MAVVLFNFSRADTGDTLTWKIRDIKLQTIEKLN